MATIHPPRRRVPLLAAVLGLMATLIVAAPLLAAQNEAGRDIAVESVDVSARALEDASRDELRDMVGTLADERDSLARSLEHFEDLYAPLEANRQLLFELRKGTPETRPEAEAQLERLRSLAVAADPSQLTPLIAKVQQAAPAFFDWRYTEFADAQEATRAYVDSGAGAFDTTMSEFRNEVLLSVANRLDGLLTVLDRLR
jgi:hypothetical protein